MSRLVLLKYQTDNNKRYLVRVSEFAPTLARVGGANPNSPVTDLVQPQPLLMRASRKGNSKTQPIARRVVLAPTEVNSRGIRSNIEVVVFRVGRFAQYAKQQQLQFRGDTYRVVKLVPEQVP